MRAARAKGLYADEAEEQSAPLEYAHRDPLDPKPDRRAAPMYIGLASAAIATHAVAGILIALAVLGFVGAFYALGPGPWDDYRLAVVFKSSILIGAGIVVGGFGSAFHALRDIARNSFKR